MRSILFLIAIGFVALPGRALYGGTPASPETSTYVFLPGQSTMFQTGGIAGLYRTYSIEGRFQLQVDPEAGTASFLRVDANAVDDKDERSVLDLNEVFNLTGLAGAVVDETSVRFEGKTGDGSSVLITLTFAGDTVLLEGETTPPRNSADFFVFALDALACRECPTNGADSPNGYPPTSEYVFVAGASTVIREAGCVARNLKVFVVEGRFHLLVDLDAGTARFDRVDASMVDASGEEPDRPLGEVLNSGGLVGILAEDGSILFEGQGWWEASVRVTPTPGGRCASISGWIAPPSTTTAYPIFIFDAVAQRKYSGGTGEPNDPYLIYTAEQMNAIGSEPNDWDKHFRLVMDIDLGGLADSWLCLIGNEAHPFRGTFDGNGHTISSFTYVVEVNEPNRPWIGESQIGLFRCVEAPGEIRGLGLVDPNVRSAQTCTGLVQSVGALVGELRSGSMIDCHVVQGLVSAYSAVGGLVGRNVKGTISDCHATCRIAYRAGRALDSPWPMRPPSLAAGFGGLVGHNSGGIYGSYAAGSVHGAYMAGGLVGTNDGRAPLGIICNCLATGDVSGKEQIGGLVGQNKDSIIQNSYAAGRVSGDECAGGLVGANYDGVVTGSFWDLQTSGQATSTAGEGKTTAEMQTPGTFLAAGWDFVGETANGTADIWWIDEGNDYPRLWWELDN